VDDGDAAGVFLRNAALALRRRRAPFVLCYHGLGRPGPGEDEHGLLLDPALFAAHLDVLVEAGYRLVTARELWATVEDRGPAKAAGLGAITFDDGLRDTMRQATEMLAARGAVGTLYAPTALLGHDHPDLPGRPLVDAGELRALADAGWEIGSHGVTHVDLTAAAPADADRELRDSRDALAEVLGAPPAGIAYPFGRHTPATDEATRRAGYAYACACAGAGPWRPYAVPREPVFPSTTALRLRVKAAGLYGPVHVLRGRHPAPR
jgi:peptidoglycan/xylan/chitin deacetylase (PgdA/CDA1 family)